MPQTRPNGIKVPIPSDDYNPPQDMADMADSTNSIIDVADLSARDSLPALFGGVLPVPTVISRADHGGDLEIWTGDRWRTINETSNVNTADVNWSYTGRLSRLGSGDGKYMVTLADRLARVGSGFAIGTTLIPFIIGFIPPGYRPEATFNGWALMTNDANNPTGQLWYQITTSGDLLARLDSGSTLFDVGWRIHLSGNWTTA